ncbi:hypothetical protein B0H11DRAFT_2293978 [Mycena galericulata]|nr:hypothetical protein B0H11DRAFT_2293978 [Mycena galericulata]
MLGDMVQRLTGLMHMVFDLICGWQVSYLRRQFDRSKILSAFSSPTRAISFPCSSMGEMRQMLVGLVQMVFDLTRDYQVPYLRRFERPTFPLQARLISSPLQMLAGLLKLALDDLTCYPNIFRKRPDFSLRVPPEIMSHIFRFCVPEALTDVGHGNFSVTVKPYCIPLALSAVCRYWRAVAFSTRELWTSVSFPSCTPGSTSLSEAWFARGGIFPLSVGISDERFTSAAHTSAMIRNLCLQSARLQEVHIVLPRCRSNSLSISGAFPHLTSATLAMPTGCMFYDSHLVADLQEAPQLLRVHLIRVLQCDRILLPWAQITCIELRHSAFSIEPGLFLSIFDLCPNLLRCAFIQCTSIPEPTPQQAQQQAAAYSHAKLDHLSVDGHVHEVYNSFTFPSLTSMKIEHCNEVCYHLAEFLFRSVALKSFSISFSAGSTTSSFLQLFNLVPTLTSLTVDCSDFTAKLCTTFFCMLGSGLCPNLEHLSISDSNPERGFSYSGLEAMLWTRWSIRSYVTPLLACTVVFSTGREPRRPPFSVGIRLEYLASQGMDIDISSPTLRCTAFVDLLP